MRMIIGITALLLICILTSACTASSPDLPAIEKKIVSEATQSLVSAPVIRTPDPFITTLSDKHPNASLSLEPGVIIVAYDTSSAQRMGINFGNQSLGWNGTGSCVFDTNNSDNGSVAFQVTKKDNYSLNISGTGAWTANVTKLTVSNPLKVPLHFSGAGMTVTPVIYLEKGLYLFERNMAGIGTPMYNLQYTNGNFVEDPKYDYNGIFIPESKELSRIISVPESGIYYFNVGVLVPLTNNWSISITNAPPGSNETSPFSAQVGRSLE